MGGGPLQFASKHHSSGALTTGTLTTGLMYKLLKSGPPSGVTKMIITPLQHLKNNSVKLGEPSFPSPASWNIIGKPPEGQVAAVPVLVSGVRVMTVCAGAPARSKVQPPLMTVIEEPAVAEWIGDRFYRFMRAHIDRSISKGVGGRTLGVESLDTTILSST